MEQGVITFLVAIGLVQGSFLSFSLFRKEQYENRNLYLILLILVYLSVLMQKYLVSTTWVLDHLPFFYVTFSTPLLIGPFFYLYTRAIVNGIEKNDVKTYLHFLPFIGFILYFSIRAFSNLETTSLRYHAGETPMHISILGSIKAVHMITYGIAAYLFKKKSKHAPSFRKLNPVLHRWVDLFLKAYLLTWAIGVSSFIFGHFKLPFSSYLDDFPILFLVMLLYGLSYVAMRNPLVFEYKPKYRTSTLSEGKANQLYKQLKQVMEEEEPFLEEGLKMESLAKKLMVSTSYLSRVINEKEGKNFQDFINAYRVKAFQKALLLPSNDHKKILAIAFEVGFGSKTVMNKVFKKETGITPSEYLKKYKNTSPDL